MQTSFAEVSGTPAQDPAYRPVRPALTLDLALAPGWGLRADAAVALEGGVGERHQARPLGLHQLGDHLDLLLGNEGNVEASLRRRRERKFISVRALHVAYMEE